MLCYFYMMLLQVFTPMNVSLHIHVLTCVNVPITVRSCDHPKQTLPLLIAILLIILLSMSV